MGVLSGIDSDVWVTSAPSIALTSSEGCPNSDAGLLKQYTANTHKYWDRSVPVVVQVGTDAKQTVTITGAPTGGTFELIYSGQTTGPINWNTTAAQLAAALIALSNIGSGDVVVTGGPGPASTLTVEFTNVLGGAVQPLMTLTANNLTGGSSPSVTIATVQTGVAWATQAANTYTFQWVGGIVIFTSALAVTQVVQILTGNFFNVSQLANCTDWELDLKSTTIDVTVFQSAGWGAFQAVLSTAIGKINSFVRDGTLDSSLANLMVFILYVSKTANSRWECYGWLSDEIVKSAVKGVVTKDVGFTVEGAVYFRPS